MLSRGGDVEIEPYYCLPVGTNGVLSAQMAAAVAAQSQAAAQGNPGGPVGGVAWSQPTSPTPLARGPFASAAAVAAAAGVLSPTHGATAAAGLVGGAGAGGTIVGHRLTYPKKNDEGKSLKLIFKKNIYFKSALKGKPNTFPVLAPNTD